MAGNNACVISTLLYRSETWTTYATETGVRTPPPLLSRHQPYTWHILARQRDLPRMYTLLRQRRLRWLGHVRQIDDGRIAKYILHGKLATGKITTSRPQLRYKDVCKRDRQYRLSKGKYRFPFDH